jgi:hypothetical protein
MFVATRAAAITEHHGLGAVNVKSKRLLRAHEAARIVGCAVIGGGHVKCNEGVADLTVAETVEASADAEE